MWNTLYEKHGQLLTDDRSGNTPLQASTPLTNSSTQNRDLQTTEDNKRRHSIYKKRKKSRRGIRLQTDEGRYHEHRLTVPPKRPYY